MSVMSSYEGFFHLSGSAKISPSDPQKINSGRMVEKPVRTFPSFRVCKNQHFRPQKINSGRMVEKPVRTFSPPGPVAL